MTVNSAKVATGKGRATAGAAKPASTPPAPSRKTPGTDQVIYDFAGRQHGVVSRAQLVAAGVPAYRIDYRLKAGRLRPLYRGVYRVGPVRGAFEKEMAAVLACGGPAVVSHVSAAAHWGLLPHPQEGAPVHVSVLRANPVRRPGVRVHRVSILGVGDQTRHEGVPVTVPARTLLDLGACVGLWELERALARADRSGLTDLAQLAGVLERHPRRAGTRALRALLSRQAGPAFTRSEAESRFLALVRRARLTDPDMNTRIEGYEVDMLWREARLIVEIDGYAYHSSRGAFEQDRRRDAALVGAGFRVLRFTWRQITKEPEATVVRLVIALETKS